MTTPSTVAAARAALAALRDRRAYPQPTRQPTTAYRVRWVRRSWARHAAGGPAWNHRWYVTHGPANKFAHSLADAGAVVQIDAFTLDHRDTTDFPPIHT